MNRETVKFTSELDGRMRHALLSQPSDTAEFVLKEVLAAIPSGVEYEHYRESLDIFEVVEPDPEFYSVGVLGKPKPMPLRMIDTFRSLLYIQPSGSEQLSEAAMVLKRYEPWTVATIPYEPSLDEADVVVRMVTPREVNMIEVGLRKIVDSVRIKLERLGVALRESPTTLLGRKVLLDLSFFALRIEFGYDGFQYKPHWRPTLRKVKSRGMSDNTQSTMLDPGFDGWKKDPIVKEKVPAQMVHVEDFQERTKV